MEKKDNKIVYLLSLLFIIFVISYILVLTLLPLIYLIISSVIFIMIFLIGSYVVYKKEKQILPFVILRFLWNLIKIMSSTKPNSEKEKASPPLTEYEKNGIIFELARGKCEHLDCNIQDELELFYIVPRNEGGGNTFDNLVVLCPSHYDIADKGVISKGLLRYFINERDK